MIGLAFSGGKDSWACLWLNKHRLADIHVIWVNTGKNFPELLASVEKAKAMCPNFHEVRTDRDGQNRAHGIPADVVPINWTALGQSFTYAKPVMIQSYLGCCFDNISGPLHLKVKELGLTEIIRGQRMDESHKGGARDGAMFDGVRCSHPIEDWTKEQVLSFVAQHMELPGHFRFEHSSMDCFDCTAYVKESADKVAFMKTAHPDLHAQYSLRNEALTHALQEAIHG